MFYRLFLKNFSHLRFLTRGNNGYPPLDYACLLKSDFTERASEKFFVVVTDVGLAASSLMLLRDYSRENARKVKKNVLLWFIIGLVAFIVGAVK